MRAPSPTRTSGTARVLFVLSAAIGLLGVLWVVCNLVSNGRFPIASLGTGNLIVGIALVIAGVVLVLAGASRDRVPRG